MAEDVYQMVVERDMLDQCMFICLEDDLLEELEEIHPEAQTGYLCFMSFGNIEKMAVDALLLEEETATPTNIYTLHDAGKKVGVWTVNSHSGMRHFLMSDADMIITDKVSEAQAMRVRLTEDDDVARVSARYLDN
jgi:glycerophosphoryl diester phosphodiesterase